MNIPIFIEYETKSRDLDGRLLLTSHLLNAGFSKIYIGAGIPIRKEALCHTKGIYFFKSVWNYEEDLYKELKNRGFILVLIHAEGAIYSKDNKISIEELFNKNVLTYFDYNFSFGKQIKKDIEELYGNEVKCKNIVSGEPRFDLLKPRYISYFKKKINIIQKKYCNIILINTSFSLANPLEGYGDYKDFIVNRSYFSDESKKSYIEKIEFYLKILDEFVRAINALALCYPNINFIVRPHPSESLMFYQKKFKRIKNIFVTNKGNVAIWILASMGVIHYDCTTGVEALLAGKPVISYSPIVNDDLVSWLPVKISKKIHDLPNLLNEVGNIQKGAFKHFLEPQIKTILYNSIHNFMSESAPIIANVINKEVEKFGIEFYNKNSYIKNRLIKYNILTVAKLILKRNDVSGKKFGRTNKKEIKNKIIKLQKILKFSEEFKIKVHSINSFLITQNNLD